MKSNGLTINITLYPNRNLTLTIK